MVSEPALFLAVVTPYSAPLLLCSTLSPEHCCLTLPAPSSLTIFFIFTVSCAAHPLKYILDAVRGVRGFDNHRRWRQVEASTHWNESIYMPKECMNAAPDLNSAPELNGNPILNTLLLI